MELVLTTGRPAGPATGERVAAGRLRMGAAIAVVALVAFISGAHVPQVAHTATGSAPAAVASSGQAAAADVPHIAGRVLPIPGRAGAWEAVDPSYRATFDGHGVAYLPAHATQPLSLSLSGIARGDERVPLDRQQWTGRGSVAERAIGSGITERVTASKGSIEWDVVLAHRLAGTGDLAITADLHGLAATPTATNVGGHPALRLALPGAGTATLGQLVVKDATGSVLYRALPHATAGQIVLDVPARVLDHARYPLTIDPTVSNPTPVVSNSINYNPSMAFDGSNYLVVWQQYVAGSYDIYGSIIAADGSAQLPAFRISQRTDSEVAPKVAYTGFRFLVVWQDQFNGSATDYDVRGQMLDTLGGTVGSEIGIATPTSRQEVPVVAAGSGQFMVAWQDNRPGYYTIYAQRIDLSGTKTNGNFEITSPNENFGYSNTAPDIAWNGSVFLAVWQQLITFTNGGHWDYIGVRPVSADGVPAFTTPNTLNLDTIHAFDPAVASDGTSFFCVWEQGSDIYGSRVDLNGVWYTGDDFPISTANDTQDDPAITYNAGNYFVAWRDRRDYPNFSDHDIYAARIKPDGTNLDSSGIPITRYATEEYSATVAPAPKGKWGVAYVSDGSGSTTINLRTAAK